LQEPFDVERLRQIIYNSHGKQSLDAAACGVGADDDHRGLMQFRHLPQTLEHIFTGNIGKMQVKQDEIVAEYGKRYGIPFVIVRPGYVYGPGNLGISGRVGINLFGLFLHLGGANPIPFTYVDNCAEAIALAGLTRGVDGEVFNVVDDELPSSREFLRLYKRNVGRFTSLYIPHVFSYALCYLWERYSVWSKGQLEPVYNCKKWHAYWKKTRYSNQKVKGSLGWAPTVSMAEGLRRYFQACRGTESNA